MFYNIVVLDGASENLICLSKRAEIVDPNSRLDVFALARYAGSMVILVIGPSGVGKSDYGEHAAKVVPDCRFFDLDALVSRRAGIPASQLLGQKGSDAFLRSCQQEVDDISHSCTQGIAVVAVGAGALESGSVGDWLSRHAGPTIAVVAPPDEVYRRGGPRNIDRSLERFTQTEYSPRRKGLYYKSSTYQLDVAGLPLEEARIRFACLIRDKFAKTDGSTSQPSHRN
jgi:shikimate kinase